MTKPFALFTTALLMAVLSTGLVQASGRWDNHSRAQLVEEIEARDTLIGAQESLMNVYRCQFGVDVDVVPGGCSNGKPATDSTTPSQPNTDARVPSLTVSQSAAGYRQPCLTTTGCSLDYFSVPTNQFLEVGEDIAPGKWNLGERFSPSCGVYRFNTAIDSHPFYGLGSGNRGNVEADYLHEFRPRFLIQQPSGAYRWHPAVIEEHDFFTGGVRWPDVATFTIEESDYMVVIKTGSGRIDRGC
ncbi:MAG: hypothetical protein KTV68_00235 [Acidimicrobiia bacterium]|nr:hypothetical protein [Acidimicrobiia bacterium]MCY4433006.1 hypothetical protein [bacterium]